MNVRRCRARRPQISQHSTVLAFVELVVARHIDDRQATTLGFNPRHSPLAYMNVTSKYDDISARRVDVEGSEFEVQVT